MFFTHLFFRRRILYQTAVAIHKGNTLRRTNLLYSALKAATQEFPDVDKVRQQLCYTRRALTSKARQIKALSAEANIKSQEIKIKDSNLKEIREELMNKKQILLCEKRDKQKLKAKLSAIKNEIGSDFFERPSNNIVYKTAGAGFRFINTSTSE